MASDLELRYLEGVASWGARDLETAVSILESAVAEPGAAEEGWWHSASRALAQIALESDDANTAERHLRQLSGTGVGDAQTLALRARRWQQVGDEEEEAIAEVHAAAVRLAEDRSTDVGSLMNGAIALAWCSEILAALGYGDDASALTVRARGRVTSAGVDDRILDAMLTLVEASVANLVGMSDYTLELLDRLDLSLSPDLEIQAERERARIAGNAGNAQRAEGLYQRCIALSIESGYSYLGRSIARELVEGPPRLRTDRAPIGQWDLRSMEGPWEDHRPYAVVISMPVKNQAAIHDFEASLSRLFEDRPHLGFIDGTGSDGTTWEIFLEGDDPSALWVSIRPLLSASRSKAAEIQLRQDGETIRFRHSG